MTIKSFISPLVIIALSIVFIAVSAGVYMTRGKSGFWISKKLFIGSLLLSLTSIVNQSCDIIGTSCYDAPDQPISNYISFDNSDYSDSIIFNIKTDSVLTGVLYDRNGVNFSFNITDTLTSDTLQIGAIYPLDGNFDESMEDIYIEINKTLPANEYILKLYDCKESEQSYPIYQYRLNIKNED